MDSTTLVFLADGFEELEAIAIIDILRRANISVQTVSITENRSVIGAHNVPLIADTTLHQLPVNIQPQAIILPGGMPGALNLANSKPLLQLIQSQNKAQRLLAAICAAPTVLAKAGVGVNEVIATCYPGFEEQMTGFTLEEFEVVNSHHFITAQGPAFAIPFALAIVARLCGQECTEEVKQGMLL